MQCLCGVGTCKGELRSPVLRSPVHCLCGVGACRGELRSPALRSPVQCLCGVGACRGELCSPVLRSPVLRSPVLRSLIQAVGANCVRPCCAGMDDSHFVRSDGTGMDLPKRKKIRLEGHDYSSNGAYFVTICAYDRAQIFGDIYVGQGLCSCRLSHIGRIVQDEIQNISSRYSGVRIDKYAMMPNHVHLVIVLERQEQSHCPTVGDVICVIKSVSTKTANRDENKIGRKIWQYRFHDHIIRNEQEYQRICRYIDENPLKWRQDCFYCETVSKELNERRAQCLFKLQKN